MPADVGAAWVTTPSEDDQAEGNERQGCRERATDHGCEFARCPWSRSSSSRCRPCGDWEPVYGCIPEN